MKQMAALHQLSPKSSRAESGTKNTALCKLFDAETDHGQNMSSYSAPLDQAVAAIVAQFARKNAANLFAGRGGKLVDASKTVKNNKDFELITWLVIK